MNIEITTKVQVTSERISNLLCTALDAGVGSSWYWIGNYTKRYPDTIPEYWHDIPLYGGCIMFQTVDDFDDDIDMWYTLDEKSIKKGLNLMASKHNRHWQDFINENGDGETGDVFLQLCLFGKIVYG